MPGDEEVAKALSDARVQRKKNPGKGVVKESKNGAGLVLITSTEQFRNIVMLPGKCLTILRQNLFTVHEATTFLFSTKGHMILIGSVIHIAFDYSYRIAAILDSY